MPPIRVFIGYDRKQPQAFTVCERSILRYASKPVLIEPLIRAKLETLGAFRRWWHLMDGQTIDAIDHKPFATEFSFTRFLVPALTQYRGWAIFCDCDFLWRDDIATLAELANNPAYACRVVKHEHKPPETLKMRGQKQAQYHRKNWSSLCIWNCAHESNVHGLTPYQVNNQPGHWLHGFQWLDDHEIGDIPHAWNWLEGHSPDWMVPHAVHFTRGTPDMDGYADVPYADEWRSYLNGSIDLQRSEDGHRRLAGT